MAANTYFYIEIGGETYTSFNLFKTEYNLENIAQAEEIKSGIAMLNTERGAMITPDQKDRLERGMTFRIKNIDAQLKEIKNRYVLMYQSLRDVKKKLEGYLQVLKGITPVSSSSTSPVLNIEKQARLKTKLMSVLLKIGYFATHPDAIKEGAIPGWNKVLEATTELMPTGNLLNDSGGVNDKKSYLIGTDSFSTNPRTTPPTQYANVADYIKSITNITNSEAAYSTHTANLLNTLETYHFIESTDKANFQKKNTSKLESISGKIKKSIQARFSYSLTVILQYYRTLFGNDTYLKMNTEPTLKILDAPTFQFSLQLLDSITKKIYEGGFKAEKVAGIHKLNVENSKKLIPILEAYRELNRGAVALLDKNLQVSPFAWFVMGKDIRIPGELEANITTTINDATITKTFMEFIDDKERVFMFVHGEYTVDVLQVSARIYDDSKDNTALIAWNEKIDGKTLEEIGMTNATTDNYSIRTNVSLPMLQFMTFLVAANQSVPSPDRYDKLVLPPT
jgi:hypothetical protein